MTTPTTKLITDQSSLSMFVFSLYMLTLGLAFMFIPNPIITIFGFEPVTDFWIRIVGLLLLILSVYYYMAVKEKAYNFYRWTTIGRLPIFFVFLAFVILNIAPPILLLFGAFETGCAIWTLQALKKETVV